MPQNHSPRTPLSLSSTISSQVIQKVEKSACKCANNQCMCTGLNPRSGAELCCRVMDSSLPGRLAQPSSRSNQKFAPSSILKPRSSDLKQDGWVVGRSCAAADIGAPLHLHSWSSNLTRVAFHLNSASPANRPNRDAIIDWVEKGPTLVGGSGCNCRP